MKEQTLNRIVQKRIFWIFSGVTFFFLVLLLLLLPYRLYTRDVLEARQNAREVSNLIRSGLLSTMISTGESKDIRGLIREFQKKYEFQFRMIRSSHVEKQHGIREDEQATDELIRQVLASGKSRMIGSIAPISASSPLSFRINVVGNVIFRWTVPKLLPRSFGGFRNHLRSF